ncbi:FAD-binding oxidoreductase [SAR202 cluster bacterium AD-804-J14_MRT_500m]|nr:FAD-binding oxidoreductase [SAR202 cluster bacterium AD-804-J14_MRT_500m]
MAESAEAIIIGGGVMGTSILYNLATRGMKSPILLERDTLGAGSTGRSSGAIRMHYSTTVNASLAFHSLGIFRNFDEMIGGGDVGFVETGYMVFVPPEATEGFHHNIQLQQALGIDTQIVTMKEAKELAPAFHYGEEENFAWESQSGHGDPSGTAMAYATRARDLGARIILESEATSIEVQNGRVSAVITPHERFETGTAVVATGPWSSPFMERLGVKLPLMATRHEVFLLRRRTEQLPFHPGGGDMTNLIYFRPEGTDLTLVGNGNHEDEADPDNYNPRANMPYVEDVWTRLANRLPAIQEAELFTGYAGLYTTTPDLHPVIDRVDGIEGLYICTGFSGHGFKLAPAVGIVMAELILDGNAKTIDISPLRMGRFQDGNLNQTQYSFKVIA